MLTAEINPPGFPRINGVEVRRYAPTNGAASQAPTRTRFTRTNTNAIMAATFDPIRWIVPGYVPEGFSVLAGRQKLGKTWLAIDWALAVACGGFAMGSIDVEGGDVLYIDAENGARRIQRRIQSLYPDERERPDLSRLEWVTDPPALDKGFIDALDDWRRSVSNPRFVVIDVLQRIKPPGNASRTSYENDYSIWAPLQRWATENGIAVVGLHHTKKGGADDPLEALSGSNGLSACADTTLVLDRSGEGITLYVRGRDVDEKETALSFDAGRWSIKGEASEVRRSYERYAILKALMEADAPMNPREIAIAADMARVNVDKLLSKMGKAGEVTKTGRGFYVHPDRRDLLTDQKTHTTGQNGQKVRNPAYSADGDTDAEINQYVNDPQSLPENIAADGNLTVLTDLTGGETGRKQEPAVDWEARARAIVTTVGSATGRRMTPEGEALLLEMLAAGVTPRRAALIVGIARQSVAFRAKRMKGVCHD